MGINQNLSNMAMGGMMWRTAEMLATQIMQFVVSIILARLILPSEYGIVAIITVFISVAQAIVNGGFCTVLIQKKTLTQQEQALIFTMSLLVSAGLCVILLVSAPVIATYYQIAEIVMPLRVLSLTLLLDAFIAVQQALMSRNLEFKLLFIRGVLSTCLSGGLGIAMALMGHGTWALIAQQVSYKVILEIILMITVRWRPTFRFDFRGTKGLFSFGVQMLVSSVTTTLYNDVRTLVIGKRYSAEDLGLYNKGKNFPSLIVNGVNNAISTTMLPIYSKAQTDLFQVKLMVRRSLQVSSYVIFPLMTGMAALAYPMIDLLLTQTWIDCVPYVQICCVMYAILPVTTSNTQAFSAIGRSDMYMKVTVIRQLIGLALLITAMPFGVTAIAISGILDALVGFVANIYPNRKLMNYSAKEYLADYAPALIMSTIMYAAVYAVVRYLALNSFLLFVLGVLTGVAAYVALSAISRNRSFIYIRDHALVMLKNRKNY